MRQIFLAGFELPDRIDIAARQRGLVRLERHRLAQFAGADQFGFALDDAEQRAHDIHQILGELTRIDGGCGRSRWRLRLWPWGMLGHLRVAFDSSSSRDWLARGS